MALTALKMHMAIFMYISAIKELAELTGVSNGRYSFHYLCSKVQMTPTVITAKELAIHCQYCQQYHR